MRVQLITDFKRWLHKRKMAKKIFHDDYYSFDICDWLPNTIFIIFRDFYENGGLEIIAWDSDDVHIYAKKSMDKIYHWICRRETYIKWNEDIMSDINKITGQRHEWIPADNNCTQMLIKYKDKNAEDYNRKMFRKHIELEEKIRDKDTEFLKLIMEIRGFLWT